MSTLSISAAALTKVVPGLNVGRATIISELANTVLPSYGIEEENIIQEFFAQALWESADFSAKSENLNYSAKELMDTFGKKHFRTMVEAQRYEHQPEKIANYVYGGRLGNNKPGDGWAFRGAGFIQLTGRDIVTQYAIRNKFDAITMANLLRTDDKWAFDSAAWFFAVAKNLVPIARKNDFKELTHRINGGQNGEAGREKLWALCKQFLITSPAAA